MKTAAFAALLVALPALAAPPAAPAEKPVPLPKPMAAGDAKPAHLPAFLGLFGPASLIEKTGFRSKPGAFVEYAVTTKESGGAKSATLRLQEVGPAERGERWIEMLGDAGQGMTTGMRMLTKGDGDGNIERLIAAMPAMPAMELPLDGAMGGDTGDANSGAPDDTVDGQEKANPLSIDTMKYGPPKLAGHETVTTPVGRFDCSRWVMEHGGKKVTFWTTTDPKVWFIGAVKMAGADGDALLTKVGDDALAKIPVPPKAR